jgi:hypothetical protein
MPWYPSDEQLRFWRLSRGDEWTPTSAHTIPEHLRRIRELYTWLAEHPATVQNLQERFAVRRLIKYNKWSIMWLRYVFQRTGIRAWTTSLKMTASAWIWPALAYAYYRSTYILPRASWPERLNALCSHDLTDSDILLGVDFDHVDAFQFYLVGNGAWALRKPLVPASGQKVLTLHCNETKPLTYNHAYATAVVAPPYHQHVTLLFQTWMEWQWDFHEFSVAIGLAAQGKTWFTGIVLKPDYHPRSTQIFTPTGLEPHCAQLKPGHLHGFTTWELTIDISRHLLLRATAASIDLQIDPTPLLEYEPKSPEHGLLTFGVSGYINRSSTIAIRNILLASHEPDLFSEPIDPLTWEPAKRYKPGLNYYAPIKETEIEGR